VFAISTNWKRCFRTTCEPSEAVMTRLSAKTRGPVRATVIGRANGRPGTDHRNHDELDDGIQQLSDASLKLLRFPAVRERTGLSRSTIWRLERRGAFPRHHRISANAVAWLEDDVADWIRSKVGVAV
jgi:prophage regulatory protein